MSASLRELFGATDEYLVGVEDEFMLLDPETLELAPRAREVLDLLDGDGRFKLELPASQLEIVTPPCRTVGDAAALLAQARRDLVAAAEGRVNFAAAGIHPFAKGVGELNRGERYDPVAREYGSIATRELSCALQVHVSVGDADRALAVYNAARSYLPHLAALAANAPFYEGVDTGLASVRPKIAQLLPRQGVPPPLASWDEFAAWLDWGARSGSFQDPATWWWELRPHPRYGTLEFRVPDGQSTVADAAAVASVVQSLVAWLGDRHDASERLVAEPTWLIEENSWSACRYGVEGDLVEVGGAERRPTREILRELLERLAPRAHALGCARELESARRLIEVNGAIAQRRIAAGCDTRAVARWLANRFCPPSTG
jgi:glutamate---cysteine ligase / carboxylate-amine ligase